MVEVDPRRTGTLDADDVRGRCLDSAAATADCLIASRTLFIMSPGSLVPAGITP